MQSLPYEYLQWDVRNWSRAIHYWQSVVGEGAIAGANVLEIGSRDGGLSLWLAHQGAVSVICSDVGGPSERAKATHLHYGVQDIVEYASIDATDIGQVEAFDFVVFKSVLGGIGGVHGEAGQRATFASIHRALRPGGYLLFAENLRASPAHEYMRRHFVEWGRSWRYPTVHELKNFSSPYESLRIQPLGFLGAFGRSEAQRSALARWDQIGAEKVVPPNWRYFAAGVAGKSLS